MFIHSAAKSVISISHRGALRQATRKSEEEALTTSVGRAQLMPIDQLFEDLLSAGKVTEECGWLKEMLAPLLGGMDVAAERHKALLEWLTQQQSIKAADGSFEIFYSYMDLFTKLGISDFYIVGSSILSKVLGMQRVAQVFQEGGIPSIMKLIGKQTVSEIFHCNDVDFRFFVSKAPDSYTKEVVRYLASKLADGCFGHLSLYQREEMVRAQVITEFYRCGGDESHAFAMISFGQSDLFFSKGPLERSYLYHSDAWRACCRCVPNFSVAVEGDFNGGWDSLLLQMMRILRSDNIEALNFAGVLSFFHNYTKGKRPLSAVLEGEFITRFTQLAHELGPEKCHKLWLKSIEKHFMQRGEAALLVALNASFLWEEFSAEAEFPLDLAKLLQEPALLQTLKSKPFLLMLHTISCQLQVLNPLPSGVLAAFLQIFTYLHCAEKRCGKGIQAVEFFVRRYGKRAASVIKWHGEKFPFYLVVGGNLYASLLKIKAFFINHKRAEELHDLLHQLYKECLPPQIGEEALFTKHLNYEADSLLAGIGPEDLFQQDLVSKNLGQEAFACGALEMLNFPSPLFQQLGFELLCHDGIMRRSSTYFPAMMRVLPQLLVREKFAVIRQRLMSHFIQYAMHTSRWGRLLPHAEALQSLYTVIGRKHATASEMAICLLKTFAVIDQVDCAAAACVAWKSSSLLFPASVDYVLGGELLQMLPSKYHAEFLHVFKEFLNGSKESYRKVAALFFLVNLESIHNHKAAVIYSAVGQLMIHKATTNAQVLQAEQKRFLALSKLIFARCPEEGFDFLLLLEKRQLLSQPLKQLFCEQMSGESRYSKTELLLLWVEKVCGDQPTHTMRQALLEERIDLLLEGYDAKLTSENSGKLAKWIMRLLLGYEEQKFALAPRIQKKLDSRGRWIFETLRASAVKSESSPWLHCAFLHMMQIFGCSVKLLPADLEGLEQNLYHLLQDSSRLDLICGLLPMHRELFISPIFLDALIEALLQASKFDLAEIYVQKMALLAADCSVSLCLKAVQCLQGLLTMNLPLKAHRLVVTFAKAPPFITEVHRVGLLLKLVKQLAATSPKDGLVMLANFCTTPSLYDALPGMAKEVESIILALIPRFAREVKREEWPEMKQMAATLGLEDEQIFAQHPFYKLVYALLMRCKIVSPQAWREVTRQLPLVRDVYTCEAITLLFKKVSETEDWKLLDEDKAYCWNELLPFVARSKAKGGDFLLLSYDVIMQQLFTHLPKPLHQNSLSAFVEALLLVAHHASDVEAALALAAAVRNVEQEMESRGLQIVLPGHLLKWMSLYLQLPVASAMGSFLKCGLMLLKKAYREKVWGLIDKLQNVMHKGFEPIEKLMDKEGHTLIPLIQDYVTTLLACGSKVRLMPYFYWLGKLRSAQLIVTEVALAERVLGEIPLQCRKEIEALQQLLARAIQAELKSEAFALLQKGLLPRVLGLSIKQELVSLYLKNSAICENLQQTKEAALLAIGMLKDVENFTDSVHVPLPHVLQLIFSLYFDHNRIDLCRQLFYDLMQFFFDHWDKSSTDFIILTDALSTCIAVLSQECVECDIVEEDPVKALFYPRYKEYRPAEGAFVIKTAEFVLIIANVVKILCDRAPETVQKQYFIDTQAFYFFNMMVAIMPESNALQIELLDDFATHPLISTIEKDARYYFLFQRLLKHVIIGFVMRGVGGVKKEFAFKLNMLMRNAYSMFKENGLSAKERVDVMLNLIVKLVNNNSMPDLYTAIDLLAQYQENIFGAHPQELAICYKLLCARVKANPYAAFAGCSLHALFRGTLAKVSKCLIYEFDFSKVMFKEFQMEASDVSLGRIVYRKGGGFDAT